MGVTFCCKINDFCALARPRQFRDQCMPDLLTLRDAYKADLVMHYTGITPGDLELHLAITTHLVGVIEQVSCAAKTPAKGPQLERSAATG
jgi:hypothetical protein